MTLMRIVPETGMFIENVELASIPKLSDGTLDRSYVDTPVPEDSGFYWPKWNFATMTWVEGLTQSVIAEIKASEVPADKTAEEKIAHLETLLLTTMDATASLYEILAGGVA